MFMPSKNSKIKRPMSGYEVLYYKDFKIGLGKNQKENIKLLQDARANDLWMHVRNIPGSHLIVFCQKNAPKDDVIMELAKMLIKMQKMRLIVTKLTIRNENLSKSSKELMSFTQNTELLV